MQTAKCMGWALLAAAVAWTCAARGDDWPQWRGPLRDGVWRETGIVDKFDAPRIRPLWEAPVSSGYCGPTVAAGRVYVTDRLVEQRDGGGRREVERVHCFEADTGKPVWSHVYDCPYERVSYTAGPRASVTIHDGLAYALGTMGHLFCFEADSGKVVWQQDCDKQYKIDMPQWGIAAAPLVEGDLLIVQIGGRPEACLVAFDRRTGAERWKALSDRASYSAPIMIEQGGKRVLTCWTGDSIAGLDPASGKTYWQIPFEVRRMVISIATPVVHKNRLLVTSFYDGAAMLSLDPAEPQAQTLWRRRGRSEQETDGLHSIMTTPYLEGDHIYGVDSYGQLRCLEAATGERVWESDKATRQVRWGNVHMVRNGERIWMFNEAGELLITRLSPRGFEELSRAQLIEPTRVQLEQRPVCWSHPAYANRHVYIRNDEKLICASLATP